MTSCRLPIALLFAGMAIGCGVLSGCLGNDPLGGFQPAMSGNPATGKALIQSYGCGSCHVIPGIRTARGMVGPPLFYYSRRTIIAGELPNSPDNLVAWIKNPVAIEPVPQCRISGLPTARRTTWLPIFIRCVSEGTSWADYVN